MSLSVAPCNDLPNLAFLRLLTSMEGPTKPPLYEGLKAQASSQPVAGVQGVLKASLKPCHARVITAPLCLFELSLPISSNK